jgi:hypothetical protein
LTIEQRDKRPEERQPLGTGIHAFVFFVASPFTYARYAQGLRLKYKRLYFPSNAQVIFNRALVAATDSDALERLVQYIARCPFSLDRILKITPTGHVVYKAEHDSCRRFPEPASGDLRAGVNRNFQVFDPLDFLAEVTQHIPNKGEHTIRYYPVTTLSRGTGLTWRLVFQQVTRNESEGSNGQDYRRCRGC